MCLFRENVDKMEFDCSNGLNMERLEFHRISLSDHYIFY